MTQTGIENQAALRAAVNTAIKANVAIYTLDARGLEAEPPGGSAATGQPAWYRHVQRRRGAEPAWTPISPARKRSQRSPAIPAARLFWIPTI